jgi:hypothetical protein
MIVFYYCCVNYVFLSQFGNLDDFRITVVVSLMI